MEILVASVMMVVLVNTVAIMAGHRSASFTTLATAILALMGVGALALALAPLVGP